MTYTSENPLNENYYNKYVNCSATSDANYRFLNWTYETTTYNDIQNVPLFTAVFGRYFTVTYSSGYDPSNLNPVAGDDIVFEVLEDTEIQLIQNEYELLGYHFAGWKCSLDNAKYLEDETFVVSANIVFSAELDANFYFIHYNPNTPSTATNSALGKMTNQKRGCSFGIPL